MAANPSLKTVLVWLCRLISGGVYFGAGAVKIFDPQAFAADIGHYHLLPYPLTLVVGVYLPWLELVCGSAVLIGRLERGALLILVGLCGLFCAALASAWLRSLDIDCGCFGHAATTTLPVALIRSVTLGLVSLFLLHCNRNGRLHRSIAL